MAFTIMFRNANRIRHRKNNLEIRWNGFDKKFHGHYSLQLKCGPENDLRKYNNDVYIFQPAKSVNYVRVTRNYVTFISTNDMNFKFSSRIRVLQRDHGEELF